MKHEDVAEIVAALPATRVTRLRRSYDPALTGVSRRSGDWVCIYSMRRLASIVEAETLPRLVAAGADVGMEPAEYVDNVLAPVGVVIDVLA